MPSIKGRRGEKKRGGPGSVSRRRYCHFCKEKIVEVDYKDYASLRKFVSDRGKIKSPRNTRPGDGPAALRRHRDERRERRSAAASLTPGSSRSRRKKATA
jgi:small subunit ribosomal protein S18